MLLTKGEPTMKRTGLDDVRYATLLNRVERDRALGPIWYLTMHIDEEWRLVDGAPNHWDGTITDEGGDELFDLTPFAALDFTGTFAFAHRMVRQHNMALLGE